MQKKINISIDYDVWLNAKKIIQTESGMSMSKFLEITLRSLIRAENGATKDFVQDTIMDLVNADKSKKKEVKSPVRKKDVKKK